MQPLYHAAHAVLLMLAFLVLGICFLTVLFGWVLHGFIAALIFSSLFVLAQELRAVAVTRQPASRQRRARRR